MDYNVPQLINFKLDGPNLKENINLNDLVICLDEFHSILDKSYAVVTGQQRLSRDDREYFQVRASNFQHGSFLVDLEVIISGAQLLMPILGLANPYTIWEYTCFTFEFLKAVYSARQQGHQPRVKIGDNSNVFLIIGNENKLELPDRRILDIASKSKRNFARLAGTLNDNGIHNIQITSRKSECKRGISINLAEKEMFQPVTSITESPKKFYADIFDFNKETKSGKLHILSDQPVKEGDYSFSVIGEQDNNIYIESMLHRSVEVMALQEVEIDPIEGPRLLKFHIMQVNFAV